MISYFVLAAFFWVCFSVIMSFTMFDDDIVEAVAMGCMAGIAWPITVPGLVVAGLIKVIKVLVMKKAESNRRKRDKARTADINIIDPKLRRRI